MTSIRAQAARRSGRKNLFKGPVTSPVAALVPKSMLPQRLGPELKGSREKNSLRPGILTDRSRVQAADPRGSRSPPRFDPPASPHHPLTAQGPMGGSILGQLIPGNELAMQSAELQRREILEQRTRGYEAGGQLERAVV
ncbi:unnamed protein product [Pleuronectes platessa]|uniref:Uncharacterized protein n=1 Tax=Pleuronectes platessa TaxID=8262 RepID=A0A9N7Z5L3_PLEPL|nr:unnamed protein product [Pleuronectes platessa]